MLQRHNRIRRIHHDAIFFQLDVVLSVAGINLIKIITIFASLYLDSKDLTRKKLLFSNSS